MKDDTEMAIGNSRGSRRAGVVSMTERRLCVGASDGVYVDRFHVGILELVNCLLVQCRHTSIVPVNCNGLERARRRGDIATSVLVSTAQYQRYYRISNR